MSLFIKLVRIGGIKTKKRTNRIKSGVLRNKETCFGICAMRFSNKQKYLLYAELAKFVRSGFGFENACEAIIRQAGVPVCHRKFCLGVQEGLRNKKTLGQAVADLPLDISQIEINLIKVGEESGLLEQSFQHLEQHFKMALESSQKIRKGLAYPIVLLHGGIIMGLVAIPLMASWNPLAKEGAAWDSLKAGILVLLAFYIGIALVIALFVYLLKHSRISSACDRFLNKIPLLGTMRHSLAMSRFCEVFHMALKSGQKMDRALYYAGVSSSSGQLMVASCAGSEKLKQGQSLAVTFAGQTEVFPEDFRRSIANAELAGVLDEDFDRWRDYYRKSAHDSVDRLTEWAPRIFYWLVLLVVAFIMVRMGLAYRGLLENYLNWSDQY